jgi:ferritin-like metal-binding protein YciE
MFERLSTPEELYNHKLGSALKMEHKVLDLLGDTIEEAHDPGVKELLRQHQHETQGHVTNIEQAFSAFGWEPDDKPCPVLDGIRIEATTNLKRTDDALVDSVVLSGTVEAEHQEIAAYEWLVIHARALGKDDVAALLERNLEQEQQALKAVKSAAERLASAGSPRPV